MSHIVHIVLNDFVNDSRVLKAGRLMVDEGHRVTILCLKSDRTVEREEIDGMQVHRVVLAIDKLPKIFNAFKFLEFMVRVLKFIKIADLVHVDDFEPLPIVFWSKLMGRKFKILYDAHEYASEKNGLSRWDKWFIKTTEKFLVKKADVVITVSHGIAHEYKKLHRREDVPVVLNVPPRLNEIEKSNKLKESLQIADDKVVFLYQGKFLIDRGIPQLIEAFKEIDHRAVLVFMGSGTLQSEVENASQGMDNVFFHPAVPYSVLLDYTSSADYGLLTTENVCLNHFYCMPNKLFEYIQAGIPVITTNLHDCKSLILKEGVGFVLPNDTSEGYRSAINEAVNQDRACFNAALKKAKEKYYWGKEQKKLLAVYNRMLTNSNE